MSARWHKLDHNQYRWLMPCFIILPVCLTVFPSIFDLVFSPSNFMERNLSDQRYWYFWSAVGPAQSTCTCICTVLGTVKMLLLDITDYVSWSCRECRWHWTVRCPKLYSVYKVVFKKAMANQCAILCLTFWCGFYPQVAYCTVMYKSRTQIEATAWNGGPMSSM